MGQRPRDGYFIQVNNDFSGLGGDIKYFKNQLLAKYYIPLTTEVIGSLKGNIGHITNVSGEEVRVSDRFFLGNQSLRGFKSGGIGPRDATTDDALGGKQFASASAEVTF